MIRSAAGVSGVCRCLRQGIRPQDFRFCKTEEKPAAQAAGFEEHRKRIGVASVCGDAFVFYIFIYHVITH